MKTSLGDTQNRSATLTRTFSVARIHERYDSKGLIIIINTILIWRPSWSSDHSRRALTQVHFFTLTVTFEHSTNIVADGYAMAHTFTL